MQLKDNFSWLPHSSDYFSFIVCPVPAILLT